MARPVKPENEKRLHIQKVCLSNDELAQIKQAAELAGMELSPFLRQAGLGVRIRIKPSRRTGELIRQLAAIGNNLNQGMRLANSKRDIRTYKDLQQTLRQVIAAVKRVA